uniref:uncharacterized protein LOC104265567 n=1 Tax=Ciona intestinalis TaxID=7719 RepID=UPI000EF55BDF|nr:uncharacterized protein LOC104265567 [Ciona intestinalis]|eukprot:XP_026689480.1 uncharacterized protein LOC104265567 [Ciona intestinalis]
MVYKSRETVCGKTQQEHDINLRKFLETAEKCNLTFNDSKCTYSTDTIDLLGYRISKGTLKPDPERIQPLLNLPIPDNQKALQRVIGMFAYYAQWIPKYSDKIKPLVQNKEFPLKQSALESFEELREKLAKITLEVIREDIPFTIETDASDIAVSAALNQNEKPVAFYSRTLRANEIRHSSVEKEATAIVEAIRKWSHLLLGRRFKLVTDQKSVAFMYDNQRHNEVRRTVAGCKVCAEIKPKFVKPSPGRLIKATQPFERLSIDFKGPLPSATKNRYILTVVDEYSRFPFAFACSSMESRIVIRCLSQLFAIFGLPSYIHSDRGKSFLSSEILQYLNSKGKSTSNTSIYNPQGNGQCERYNAIIWSAVQLGLKTKGLSVNQWEVVLADALHSIRSLLCTTTNATPHERLFNFQRKSSVGMSTPSWLSYPGPVLVKRHVRSSKYDPLVEEVQLVHATPNYAQVRYKDGREATVSLRDVAPFPEVDVREKNTRGYRIKTSKKAPRWLLMKSNRHQLRTIYLSKA